MPWLNTRIDTVDDEGYVHVPQAPGLGLDINWDFIRSNLVDYGQDDENTLPSYR